VSSGLQIGRLSSAGALAGSMPGALVGGGRFDGGPRSLDFWALKNMGGVTAAELEPHDDTPMIATTMTKRMDNQ